MQLLYRTEKELILGGCPFIMRVKTDGVTVTVELDQNPVTYHEYNFTYDMTVTCGGNTAILHAGYALSGSCSLPWHDGISGLTLSGVNVVYDGDNLGSSAVFSWGTVYGSPDPVGELSTDGLVCLAEIAVQCDITAPVGKYPALLGVWAYQHRLIGPVTWELEQTLHLDDSHGTNAWFKMNKYFSLGDLLQYRYLIAYYSTAQAAANRGTDYEALAELTSQAFEVVGSGDPFPPYDLMFESPIMGGEVAVTWRGFRSFTGLYELQRSADGGDWQTVYTGASRHFTDRAGRWERVSYRVRSMNTADSTPTDWVTGTEVAVGASNLYIGVDGIPTLAGAVYLGREGKTVSLIPFITVGQGE